MKDKAFRGVWGMKEVKQITYVVTHAYIERIKQVQQKKKFWNLSGLGIFVFTSVQLLLKPGNCCL